METGILVVTELLSVNPIPIPGLPVDKRTSLPEAVLVYHYADK